MAHYVHSINVNSHQHHHQQWRVDYVVHLELRDSRGWSQTELGTDLNFEPQASSSLNGDHHTYLIVRSHLKALAHQRH